MRTLGLIRGVVTAQSGVTLMARVLGYNGEPITKVSITSIAYSVRLKNTATTTATGTLTVNDVVYNDLQQQDATWQVDDVDNPGTDARWGYNFRATLAATLFAAFAVDTASPYEVTPYTYQVDVEFTPASGQPFVVAFEITNIPTWV